MGLYVLPVAAKLFLLLSGVRILKHADFFLIDLFKLRLISYWNLQPHSTVKLELAKNSRGTGQSPPEGGIFA
jgi:hypothetical protein